MASNLESSLAVKGSDTIWDFSCDAFNTNEAKFYCEACSKCYCENCAKLHRQLFNSHSVFDRKRIKEWPIAKSTLNILEQCTEHTDEKVKLFCEDHSKLCCHICVALHHRTCKITYLIDETNKFPTVDVRQLSTLIQKVIEEMNEQKDVADRNLQSIEKTHEQIKEKLNNMRQQINEALDLLEKATIQEVDTMIARSKIYITQDRDECDNIQKRLQCLSEAVNEVCNKSSKLLFIASEKCQQQINNSEIFLKELKVTHEYGMEFAPSNKIYKCLFTLTGLGRIGQQNKVISLQKKSELSIDRSFFDAYGRSINAICELPSGETLVLDGNQVLLFDKKHKCLSNCGLSYYYSYDMCLISPSEAVITTERDGRHGLQMITVRNDSLEVGRKLKLPHSCIGVALHDDDLYVTSGTALYQYTLTGSLVNKLYEDPTGDYTVFKCAVSLMGDKIFVTNMAIHELRTLAKDGTVISTFSELDLRDPRGVHVTPGGQVLVCGGSSNTIIQVDGEGKKKLATLATENDGIERPLSVFYSSSTDAVMVGVKNNGIMVFKVTTK